MFRLDVLRDWNAEDLKAFYCQIEIACVTTAMRRISKLFMFRCHVLRLVPVVCDAHLWCPSLQLPQGWLQAPLLWSEYCLCFVVDCSFIVCASFGNLGPLWLVDWIWVFTWSARGLIYLFKLSLKSADLLFWSDKQECCVFKVTQKSADLLDLKCYT